MNTQDSSKMSCPRRVSALALVFGLLAMLMMVPAGMSAAQDEEQVSYLQVSQGRSLFRAWCRTCHGETAEGDGPMAEHLQVAPADLTHLSQRAGGQFYSERVAEKIDGRQKVRGHGSKDMPAWGEAFGLLDEEGGEEAVREKIAALVRYLQSIQVTDDENGS